MANIPVLILSNPGYFSRNTRAALVSYGHPSTGARYAFYRGPPACKGRDIPGISRPYPEDIPTLSRPRARQRANNSGIWHLLFTFSFLLFIHQAIFISHAIRGPHHILYRFFFACYTYIGYPLLLWLLGHLRTSQQKTAVLPPPAGCTIIIPAYNEAALLRQKISNTLALQAEIPVQVIVVTDGSTDGSQTIAAIPGITVLHQPVRQGKAAAINRAAAAAQYEILVLTDANTFLNSAALQQLLAGFENAQVGAVCGEKRIEAGPGYLNGETVYWQYESVLKRLESATGSVVGAAGELLALRRHLFTPIPEQLILDDFWLSVQLVQKGYRLVYAPGAIAVEAPAAGLRQEYERRTRIAAGAWQWMRQGSSRRLLARPFFAWQFFSHRICRWFITPVCLPLLLVANMACCIYQPHGFYTATLILQVLAYMAALTGRAFIQQGRVHRCFYIPFYFLFIHTCMLAGYVQYWRGRHTVLWQKAARQA